MLLIAICLALAHASTTKPNSSEKYVLDYRENIEKVTLNNTNFDGVFGERQKNPNLDQVLEKSFQDNTTFDGNPKPRQIISNNNRTLDRNISKYSKYNTTFDPGHVNLSNRTLDGVTEKSSKNNTNFEEGIQSVSKNNITLDTIHGKSSQHDTNLERNLDAKHNRTFKVVVEKSPQNNTTFNGDLDNLFPNNTFSDIFERLSSVNTNVDGILTSFSPLSTDLVKTFRDKFDSKNSSQGMSTNVKGYNTYVGSNGKVLEVPPRLERVEESPDYASSVVLASDILSLTSAVDGVMDMLCREQGYRFLDGLLMNKQWALQMFDASAKSPQGLLFGSSYHLGNFDECVGIEEAEGHGGRSHRRVSGKYCLATIEWSHNAAKRRSGRSGELRWAVCVPAACDASAVNQFVLGVLAHTVGNTSRVIVEDNDCYTRQPLDYNKLDVAFLSIICFFVVVVFSSTMYDVWIRDRSQLKHSSMLRDLVVSFSAVHNMRKLLSTKQPNGYGLDCIAGIKTLAMMFITAGHACLFIASGPVMDADAWDRLLRQPLNAFMLNNTLLVDTFLLLSAFLFCRLLLLELDKRRGSINVIPIYIFRYIRVTPAYLVVILFYMTWLPKIDEGPLWKDKLELEKERCLDSWWTNILYINNYLHTDTLCMFQSWYLSVDTQLFFLAPAFIFPLWRWRRVGPAILTAAVTVSSVVPAFVTYENELDPTLMVYAKEFKDISQNYFFKEAYMKTHMKMTPYFMGLLFGYFMHRIQSSNYEFPKWFKIVAWCTSVVMGTAVTFSISIFYQEWYQYSTLDAVSYAALHKLAWGLSTGWLILACATGNGGIFGKLLTWKFLVPLSRLTFCAYLVNGIIELYFIGTLRHPLHISFFNVVAISIAHIILTFVLALILCLIFESPIHGIEKVLLRSFARPSDNARVDLTAENSTSRSSSQPSHQLQA